MRARYLFRECIAELDFCGRYGAIFGTKASFILKPAYYELPPDIFSELFSKTRPAEKFAVKNKTHSEKSQSRPFISQRLSILGAFWGNCSSFRSQIRDRL